MTKRATERSETIRSIMLSLGTLRSAVSTINVAENIKGCQEPVENSREIAAQQVARLRKYLTKLSKLLK